MNHISGNTYYIAGPVAVGVYVQGRECLLIDTGLDESAARKILKELEREGLTPSAIINTHSHADHFGANTFIAKRKPVTVAASPKEAVGIQYPAYEPFYLFSSAPVKEMENKFFMAPAGRVDLLLEAGRQKVGSFEMEIIPLPGHSMEQIGVLTPDDVLFCADALLSGEIIGKYHLPYVYDVQQSINTMSLLRQSGHKAYVLAHGGLVENIREDIDVNLEGILEIEKNLLSKLEKPLTREELLAEFVLQRGIELNMIQYPLLSASLSAYLSWMANRGKIRYFFEHGKLYWAAEK